MKSYWTGSGAHGCRHAEIMRVLMLPEVRAGLVRDGFLVAPTGPAEYDAFVRSRMQLIQKIARDANLKVD